MKKVLMLVMVAVIVIATLASCGSNAAPAQDTTAATTVGDTAATTGGDTVATTAATTAATGTFDENTVIKNLNVKEYTYKGYSTYYLLLVVKNNSGIGCDLEVSVDFYDSSKKIIGTKESSIDVLGAGETYVMSIYCDDEFASYTYEFSAEEIASYYAPVAQNLKLDVTQATKKLIASVTNNGSVDAYYTKVAALFFKGNDVIYYNYTYVGDKDSKIAPGKTEKKEISIYDEYDRYETYINSYAKVDT